MAESSKSNNGDWSPEDMINTILVYENGTVYNDIDEDADRVKYPICIVRTKDAKMFGYIMDLFRKNKVQREKDGKRNSCIEVTTAEIKAFLDKTVVKEFTPSDGMQVKGFEYMIWDITEEVGI